MRIRAGDSERQRRGTAFTAQLCFPNSSTLDLESESEPVDPAYVHGFLGIEIT